MPSSASYRPSIKDTAVLVSLCLIIGGVDGYLTGAPHSRCGNMQPGHGSEGSNNPYSLEVMGKAGGYHPDKVLRVKVVGGGGYQGILLKAIKAGGAIDDENRGLFEDPVDHTRLGQCTWANDYITHEDNDPKDDTVIYRWRSKADQGTSSIQFVATILPGKNTYYMNVLSEEIPHSDTVEEEAPSSDPDDDDDDGDDGDDDDGDDGLEDIVTHPHSMGAADCRVNGILVLLVSTLMLFLRQR